MILLPFRFPRLASLCGLVVVLTLVDVAKYLERVYDASKVGIIGFSTLRGKVCVYEVTDATSG